MKFTALFLFAAALQVSARGISQTITYSVKNAGIEQVFNEIKKQSGYVFFYTYSTLKDAKPVTIDIKNADIKQALNQVFKNQPFTYSIEEKLIVVKARAPEKKEVSVLTPDLSPGLSPAPPPAGIDVTVTVVDAATNQTLEGASVMIKGQSKGVVTDVNGRATLRGIDQDATIVISFTGFQSQEIKINSRGSIGVKLIASTSELQEVIINKGYYTEKQKLSTGNVFSVKAKDIEKQPVSNPLLALQGRVPSLFITQSSGLPNSGVTVRIQGINSLNSGNDPLYVIDGVPYASQLLQPVSSILGTSGGSNGTPLSFINPQDIESIEILKDADATAIYGSRAANGAILITTKKGKPGNTKINFNIQNGWGKIAREMDLLNTRQYLDMRYEALRNDGTDINSIATTNTAFHDLKVWDTSRYTDWQKELIGRTAKYTDAQVSVSGGTTNTNFLIGAGYHRETTVFPGDLSDEKGSLHFNLNNVSPNQKLRIQLSGNYMFDNNRLIGVDLTLTALRMSPNAPMLYNPDGTLNWAMLPNGNATWINPLAYLNQKYRNIAHNLLSNGIISYQLVTGLSFQSSFGYTRLEYNEMTTSPLASLVPQRRPTSNRTSRFSNNSMSTWIIEPQLNYKRKIGKGNMETLLGTTFLSTNNSGQILTATGFNSDQVMEDIKAASSITASGNVLSEYRYNALFGRFNYNWQEKYVINVTVRRDGSSRFGSVNRFHNFWSAGGGWIFSNSQFAQQNIRFVSFGKIRASYGTTGNDQIGDYQFMNLYNPFGVPVAYQGTVGSLPVGLPNPYLEWEETKKLQAGLELGFGRDRIFIILNYYRNRSSNQLTRYALPYTSGYDFIQTNLPALIENSGWEFNLKTTPLTTKTFRWTSGINFTIPKNKLVDFPDFEKSTVATQYALGYPLSLVKLFPFRSVDPATGLYVFADKDGNLTGTALNYPADAISLVNIGPKFYGGFHNQIEYKNLELSFLFQFNKQIGSSYFLGRTPGRFSFSAISGITGNQPVWVLDRWQKPGDISSHQKFSALYPAAVIDPYSNAELSELSVTDASFIRLKNISISWNLPKSWLQRLHLDKANLFILGQNLITITKYKGLDPENQNISALPPLKQLTIGIHIGL